MKLEIVVAVNVAVAERVKARTLPMSQRSERASTTSTKPNTLPFRPIFLELKIRFKESLESPKRHLI